MKTLNTSVALSVVMNLGAKCLTLRTGVVIFVTRFGYEIYLNRRYI